MNMYWYDSISRDNHLVQHFQNCLTISQDRAIQRIAQMKKTTDSVVDEHRELKSSLSEKDERISHLKDQLQNISTMGAGFSDTESIGKYAILHTC